MELEKAINGRRTIRQYLDQPVQKDQIEQIIQAAIEAPSWKNSQSARFYVITDPKLLKSFKEQALPEGNRKKCENAPCLIVACYQKGLSGIGEPGHYANALGDQWSMFDLGLAVENLCLEAYGLGLGTLIMGIRDEDAIGKILDIPDDQVIAAVIALGHPAINPPRPKRHSVDEAAVFLGEEK